MSQVWTMKLTESTNICYVSDTVPCTIKMHAKETFMGNDSFRKCFCGEWTCLTNLVFSEGSVNCSYSVPTLGKP